MAGRSKTLQQLIDAVADRADVVYATSGVRHTTALLVTRINNAIQRWCEMVADAGDDARMVTTRTTTNNSSVRDAANWAPQQYIAQPTGLMRVRGIDVFTESNRPIPLLPFDELERDDAFRYLAWWSAGGQDMPIFFRLGGTNAAGAKLIQILPWADKTYTVDIRYIPTWVDLTTSNLSTAIDFELGGDEWVTNDAALQTLTRDGQAGGAAAQLCRGWNQELEAKMKFELACRSPVNKVDTRERRREMLSRANRLWRFP